MFKVGQVEISPVNVPETKYSNTGAQVILNLEEEADVFVTTTAYRAGSGTATVFTSINVNGGAEEIPTAKIPASALGSAVQIYKLTLPAGEHTIRLRAKRGEDGTKTAALQQEVTRIAAAVIPS